jgi:phosphopentomutase
MPRAFLVILDSVGCGGAPDADAFFNDGIPDTGANTLAHIAQACAAGRAEEGRSGPLRVPNLDALGLGAAIRLASGADTPGLEMTPRASGARRPRSRAARTRPRGTGNWRACRSPGTGTTSPTPRPAFPPDLVAEVCRLAGTDGILGNRHASGTVIIEEEGEAHLAPCSRSATPRPTASSRSPRMRRPSASTGCSPFARSSRPRSTRCASAA